ncbi:ABC transporter permease [Betaproteobacteria bacterium]|nr:ABC transporter permease [Betaproteobacteria bacterium]GHT93878.1 ABC transporter permease [Betaproteobacteria bacterium]GHT98598.1 ABC transporter permease [Betaproteobacteria bacterium]GHU00881.1 ABC transporter permease [Betaproteobacteria bacterium]GHU19814.1 ABC transporter permease [Betaproteobacteria bacterium]
MNSSINAVLDTGSELAPQPAEPSSFPAEHTHLPPEWRTQARQQKQQARFRFYAFGLLPVAAWGLLSGITLALPDKPAGFIEEWPYTHEFGVTALSFVVLWAIFTVLASFRQLPPTLERINASFRYVAPWLVASGLIFALWELLTAKLGILEPPFFAPPSSLFDAYINDYARLADSAYNSVKLLLEGILWGTAVGFVIGVSIGWSQRANYWIHPVLRLIGPLPPTALLPIAFVFFPSSHAASVFLIALATGFPVAILSWSGVASVNKAYYDVARTLGASERFLIFRVAIPAALPQVFVGLFMGFGASFVVLIVAEMMGVKSGLGWYLTWAQGYAAYASMYAALIVMTIIFSSLISLLFTVRNRVLVWQKGTVRW